MQRAGKHMYMRADTCMCRCIAGASAAARSAAKACVLVASRAQLRGPTWEFGEAHSVRRIMCTPLSVSTISLSSPTFSAKLSRPAVGRHAMQHKERRRQNQRRCWRGGGATATAPANCNAPRIFKRLLHHSTRERPKVPAVASAAAVALRARNLLELGFPVHDLLPERCAHGTWAVSRAHGRATAPIRTGQTRKRLLLGARDGVLRCASWGVNGSPAHQATPVTAHLTPRCRTAGLGVLAQDVGATHRLVVPSCTSAAGGGGVSEMRRQRVRTRERTHPPRSASPTGSCGSSCCSSTGAPSWSSPWRSSQRGDRLRPPCL